MPLTPQQETAVYNRGGSLLVSAAAGSGKTKVLVERLFSYMEQEGCQVDDFLIITYTKAAAAELRGKIAQELTRRVAERPANGHLRRQMLRVYQADRAGTAWDRRSPYSAEWEPSGAMKTPPAGTGPRRCWSSAKRH